MQSITQHALIKNNHKTCADQKQSSEVFVFHTPHFLFLFYDPTRINQARLSVLISGNLLLRKARNQSISKITVHYTYKHRMIKKNGQVVLFITRKTAVVYVPDKHIKGKMSKSLT